MERVDRLDRLAWGASLRAHGRDAIWTPAAGDPQPVRGVFDEAYKLVELDLGRDDDGAVGLSSTAPVFSVRPADLPAPPQQGDRLRIRDVDYEVIDIHADGHGGARLILHKA